MAEEKLLESAIKKAVKTGKCSLGLKEVLESLKGSKLAVHSLSLKDPSKFLEACKVASVPTVKYGGSSIDLGRLCGKPFRVIAMSIRSPGEADLSSLTQSGTEG